MAFCIFPSVQDIARKCCSIVEQPYIHKLSLPSKNMHPKSLCIQSMINLSTKHLALNGHLLQLRSQKQICLNNGLLFETKNLHHSKIFHPILSF